MSASTTEPTTAAWTADGGTMGTVPGTVAQVFILSRYQFRDYLRSRRFILMMSIVAAIGAIFTFILSYYHTAAAVVSLTSGSDAFYGTFWGGGVYVVIIFAGIIFGGDAIAGEFQNKTGYFLMGLPIRRAAVYAGKFTAAFSASLVAMVVYLVILVANGAYYLGGNAFPLALGESFVIAVLYMLALLGAVFLFSSMFKNSLYAVLVVAILFLFGFTLIDDLLIGLVKIEPWFIIDYARPVIGYPFDATLPAHMATVTTPGPRGSTMTSTTYNPTYPEGIAIMIGYALLTAIGGLFLFEREEFS